MTNLILKHKTMKKLFTILLLFITLLSYSQVKVFLSDTHEITTEYLIEVSKGRVDGHSLITKFGRNGAVGTSLTHVSIGGFYETPTTAQSLEILSANTGDNPAGAGAHKILIEGLDGNFDLQTEIITLNGTTPVALTKQFIRVYRAFVVESGAYVKTTVPSQLGQITLRNSGAGVTWFIIDTVEETATGFGMGQTQIGSHSIPRNCKAYLLYKAFSVEATKPSSVYFFKRENADDVTTPFTGTMRLFEQNDGVVGAFAISPKTVLEVIEGPAEVGFFAKTGVGTASVSVEFQLLIIRNR